MKKIYSLYENVGKKIKNLAVIAFIVEAIGAIVTGLVLFCIEPDDFWWGLLISIFGPFVLLAGTWFIYGFGELIDKACDIATNTDVSALSLKEENDKKRTEIFLKAKENTGRREKIVQEKTSQVNVASVKVSTFKILSAYSLSCDACKYAQSINNKSCTYCGAKFEKE